jgi:hypothetical protein
VDDEPVSSDFKDPVHPQPSEVQTEEPVYVMKGRRPNGDETEEEDSPHQYRSQLMKVSTGKQKDRAKEPDARQKDPENEDHLHLPTVRVPSLPLSHDPPQFGEGGLKIELFVYSQEKQRHRETEPQGTQPHMARKTQDPLSPGHEGAQQRRESRHPTRRFLQSSIDT